MTQTKKVDIPATHLWVYKKIKEKHGLGLVKTQDVIEIIRRSIRQMPKRFDYIVLDEMCEYKLLQKIDRIKCRVLSTDCDAKLKKIEDYFYFR